MISIRGFRCCTVMLVGALVTSSAFASFDFMQIEQVIGGVNGDATVQAIQLRMRRNFQNSLDLARLVVHDGSGGGDIVLIDFNGGVFNGSTGDRVLIASANFAAATSPAASPDFIMTNLIPESYFAAGSLTYEDDFGVFMYWRLSWGGSNYTGPTSGHFTNDADGQFGPPWFGVLPSADTRALLFQGSASDPSTNNDDDYELTAGAAVFTNNAGDSFTVAGSICLGDINHDGFVDLGDLAIQLSNFAMPSGQVYEDGDLDGDGDVDLSDLAVMLSEFATVCP